MAEVLVNTVGYDDSDLSDYENNFNINNNLIYQNFKSNYKFNYNQKSPRFGIDNINTNNTNNTVNTNNKVNNINNEEVDGFGKKIERISYRNSLDTIDSINNNENVFKWWCDENDYSDDFSDDSFFSPVTVSSNTATPGKGTNTLTTTNTKDTEENLSNGIAVVTKTGESGTNGTGPLGTMFETQSNNTTTNGTVGTDSENIGTVGASTVTEDNSGWKSWTNGTNQLQELKSKILNKLLNNIKPVMVSGAQGKGANDTFNTLGKGANSMVTECTTTVGASTVMEELKYYKNMNKILIEKLIYIINNNNKLEYNINNNYVTLIQNHLIKTQSFLSSITGTTNNLTTSSTKDPTGSDTVTEENSTTKVAAPNLLTGPEGTRFESQSSTTDNTSTTDTNTNTNTNTTNGTIKDNVTDSENINTVGPSTVTGDTVTKIKELELNNKELEEKIKIIEESKNNLEEDFKKTLTYMKLMKDRLKLFKQNNTQITTTNSTNTTNTNNFTTNTLNTHNSLNTVNTLNTTTNMNNMNKRNKLRRNNSSVRFKEMSELYVVPRSLSETKPIINNNKFNFFKNLFK